MALLYITYLIVSVAKVTYADESAIIDYFASDTFKTIQHLWQPEMKSFENAISLVMQQNFGYESMNVYVRSKSDSFTISGGFIFSDNIVNLVLLETHLASLPMVIAPTVTFALASNWLKINADLGRIVMTSNYILIRNQSDMVYTVAEQDTSKKSPFSFQQVQDTGELTIIAQHCTLEGYAITSLVGITVNLGLGTFKVTNCKFSLEIFSSQVGSPPVFGPYFSEKQGILLQTMLSNPIRNELMPKLQASIFSYVNTSSIFGDKLLQLRSDQNNIFKETSNYMSVIVENFVRNTIKETQGTLQLKPLELSWTKKCSDGTCENNIRITDVTLFGLDTAYSAHIGGPFKVKSPNVAEAIRFSTIQVRGNSYYENKTGNGSHVFAVELVDVEVIIEMKAKDKSFVLDGRKVYVTGWRKLEFSILQRHMPQNERGIAESFITGYLTNEIPKRLTDHIIKTFGNVDIKNTPAESPSNEVHEEADVHNNEGDIASEVGEEPENNPISIQISVELGGKSDTNKDQSETEKETTVIDQNIVEVEKESATQNASHASDNEIEE